MRRTPGHSGPRQAPRARDARSPSGSQRRRGRRQRRSARRLLLLVRRRSVLPAGTFVFVVSDFLTPPPIGLWAKLRSLQLDVTPVVVEDPVWEQSFPRVGGVVLRVADAAGRGREDVLIRRADAERLARTNEQRLQNDARGASAARIRSDPRRNLGRGGDRAALPRVVRPAASDPAATAVKAVRTAIAAAIAVAGLAAAAPGTARAAPLSVHATTQPSSVGIGDAFTYVVDVRVDPALVDRRASTSSRTAGRSHRSGDQVVSRSSTSVRLEQRLACLDSGCVPRGTRRTVTVPAPRARGALRGGGRTVAVGAPLTVSVVARVPADAVRAGRVPYRLETTLPPPNGEPRRVAIIAGTAAALLAVATVGLAAAAMRRRRHAAPPRPAEEPLARALRLLRESASRGVSDRRRAADLLARVARTRGAPPLADEATRVAWSPEQPQPATATALADKADDGTGR